MAGGAFEKTMEIFGKLPGVTEEQLEAGKNHLQAMSYSNMRAFRVFCELPGSDVENVFPLLSSLLQEPITFFHLELFEEFSRVEGVTVELAIAGLEDFKKLDFTSVWTAKSLCSIVDITPSQVLQGVARLAQLDVFGRWASKSFFEISGMTGDQAVLGLDRIIGLSEEQCWAVESSNRIPGITVDEALKNMEAISVLQSDDAWNARALCNIPAITGSGVHDWLSRYFVKPLTEQDSLYLPMSIDDKRILLKVFYEGSDNIIWEINNLHAVTGSAGEEISESELLSSSFGRLTAIFNRLPRSAWDEYEAGFLGAVKKGDKAQAVRLLRQSTSTARLHVARDCSAADIYVLLTRVTILYDSSFRLVLVPELKKRIDAGFKGKLFEFLQAVDPERIYVSTFISSLAQKGQLEIFFPRDDKGQEDILALVADSAFRDENSIIFFAASFAKLLEVVNPEARHFLLQKMITLAKDENALFAQQVRVIMQYYLEEQPRLLGSDIVEQMKEVLKAYGAVALSEYALTPFAQWREDGLLSSISVFNSDDDSRLSFIANTRHLLKNGYVVVPGTAFLVDPEDVEVWHEAVKQRVLSLSADNIEGIKALFVFLKTHPVTVDFVKTFDSCRVFHSVSVFHDAKTQERLLMEFINGGHEMFIHRGHSYWLDDHLLIPLREIVKSGKVSRKVLAEKQRFLSIGSCGAINSYFELTSIFCNKIDMLGSIGSGQTAINNSYNSFLFEAVAQGSVDMNWKEVDRRSSSIFKNPAGRDYLLPGGLPAVLYKIIGAERCWIR